MRMKSLLKFVAIGLVVGLGLITTNGAQAGTMVETTKGARIVANGESGCKSKCHHYKQCKHHKWFAFHKLDKKSCHKHCKKACCKMEEGKCGMKQQAKCQK